MDENQGQRTVKSKINGNRKRLSKRKLKGPRSSNHETLLPMLPGRTGRMERIRRARWSSVQFESRNLRWKLINPNIGPQIQRSWNESKKGWINPSVIGHSK